METKDTVMDKDATERARKLGGQEYMVAVQHSLEIPSLDECCNRRQNLAQAEISFKAGKDEATRDFLKYAQSGELDKRFNELKRVGRREVVEWVQNNYFHRDSSQGQVDCFNRSEWQAKLKEWGINA